MRDLLALRNLFGMALIAALLLGAVAGLVSQDAAKMLVPTPEQTAEQFLTALSAHRLEGAYNVLSEDLQQQAGFAGLQALVDEIEASHQGIEDAHGLGSTEQANTATAEVEVQWGSLDTQTLQLNLTKEKGLWKLSSLPDFKPD